MTRKFEHKSFSLGFTVSRELWEEFVNYTYVPSSRWQRLKRDYAPYWFLRYFPVRVKRIRKPSEYRPFINA